MQTEGGIRVPGLNQDLSREITKFDSSEFDVSLTLIFLLFFKYQDMYIVLILSPKLIVQSNITNICIINYRTIRR